jgi:hypothetical protein
MSDSSGISTSSPDVEAAENISSDELDVAHASHLDHESLQVAGVATV